MAAKLTYERDFYTPTKLLNMMRTTEKSTEAEKAAAIRAEKMIRKEYTRLRDISQKRLKRLGASMFADTQTYLRNVNHYPLLKNIQSKQDLAQRLSDLSRFVSSPMSLVSGQKSAMKEALKTLHSPFDADGVPKPVYDFVTAENFIDFGKFMEEYRAQKMDGQGYDSGDAADTFRILEKHDVDVSQIKEDFEYWLENKDTLDKLYRKRSSKGNAEALKAQHERYLKDKAKREEAMIKRMGL